MYHDEADWAHGRGDLCSFLWTGIIPLEGIQGIHSVVRKYPHPLLCTSLCISIYPMKTGPDKRKSVSHRLAIVEGHLRKVESMVNEGAYCIDIIHQSRAIQQALKKFDEQVLAQHLRVCIARDLKNGNTDKATTELIDIFGRV